MGPIHIPRENSEARRLYWFDNSSCFRLCVNQARSGDSDSAATVAMIYLTRATADSDWLERAQYWAEQATKKTSAYGYFAMFCAHIEEGAMSKAVEALRLSAKQGFGPADWSLGSMYQHGFVVRQNLTKSAEHFLSAKKRKYILAATSLNDIYTTGHFGNGKRLRGVLSGPCISIVLRARQLIGNKLDEAYLVYLPFVRLVQLAKDGLR